MKHASLRLPVYLICALLLLSTLMISGTADAAEILYDDAYTQVARTLHQANSCTSTQGLAAGNTYLYSAMIKSDNAQAVIHRVHRDNGTSCLMKNGTTGSTFFTNLGHANDMDYAVVDGKEYLFVLASASDTETGCIVVFEIQDDTLYQHARYTLSYNGGKFNPSGMAVYKINSETVTFMFKWSHTTISTGSISFRATSGNIPVTIKCYLDSTQVPINGSPRDFRPFANQGIDVHGEILYATYAGCYDIATVHQSLILGFDLTKAPGTLQPEPDLIIYIESSDYPRAFEMEDCGISDNGKLYFNTNCWLTTSDTNHDGVFVLNDFSVNKASVTGKITSPYPGVAATVQLKQGDTVKYTAVAEAADGTQTFSLDGIAPGTYDLVCRKPGHLPFTVTGIPVGNADVDLSEFTESVAAIQPIAGDLNGDGSIDLADVATLTSSRNYSLSVQEAAAPWADLNGDGLIDLQDLVIVTSSNNYGKTPTTVPFFPLPYYGSPDRNVSFVDLGDDVRMMYVQQTDALEFEAYCTTLKNTGYTEFANRQHGNNQHAIYTSEDKVIHATYAGKENAVRIAIEDAYDMSIFTEQPYEAVCEPSVTMIGQENYAKDDNGFYYQKGMSLIFLLEDGRFIIVDGGGHNKTSLNSLYTTLQNLAVDKDNITIAAWIITHAHTDHVGTFLKFTAAGYHKSIRVENIIHHFTTTMQHTLLGEEARAPQAREVFATEYANTNIIKAHTGQKIYAGGAEIEMLFTFADLEPTVLEDFNITSLMFRVTMQGKTVMILGDSTTRSSNHLVNTYGNYLKSDIVQVAHHGKTGGTVALYERIDADVLLWPGGVANFNGDGNMDCLRTRDYNAKALELAEEAYIAGANIFTLIMPYTPEDGETTRIIY